MSSADGGGERLADVHRLRPARRWRQWPLGIVLAGVGIAVVLIALDRVRVGTVVLAGSLVVAFVLRAVLPGDRPGMLAVRSRATDLVVLGILAAGLVVLTVWGPPTA